MVKLMFVVLSFVCSFVCFYLFGFLFVFCLFVFPFESQRWPVMDFIKSLIQNLLKLIRKCTMAPICITPQMNAEQEQFTYLQNKNPNKRNFSWISV